MALPSVNTIWGENRSAYSIMLVDLTSLLANTAHETPCKSLREEREKEEEEEEEEEEVVDCVE